MSDNPHPLTGVLRALAAKGDPVRVFTTFGTFDGLADVDTYAGTVTLRSYRVKGSGLRLGDADTTGESTEKYIVKDTPPLSIAATAIQGVTSINSGQVNW